MSGAPLLLAIVLLLYTISLLVMRFAAGETHPSKHPITWFYASWIIGLVMLSLPLFDYQERITENVTAYISGALGAFSIGCIASAFLRQSIGIQKSPDRISAKEEAARLSRLMRWLLILGLIGSALLILNTLLSGSLSVADRLNSDNAAQIRVDYMNQGESKIGPLYGPASFGSAIGGLGVALVMYFLGTGQSNLPKKFKYLAIAVLVLNCVGAFVAFGSRMFAVFSLLVAFLAFVYGRWSVDLRVIAYKLTLQRFLVLSSVAIVTLAGIWFSATYFLEKRVAGQSPSALLYKTHRANFSKPLYKIIGQDSALQYLAFSASYFSTPISTLSFYLELPNDRYPGPFWGQYNFPAVARWARRAAFIPDPNFWDQARYEIFKPLGDINFGTNVWATSFRDIIADFGKIGSLAFLAIFGLLTQATYSSQVHRPTAVKASIMVYLMIVLFFNGFVSTLFMPQIHWPLYFAAALLFTRLNTLPSIFAGVSNSKMYRNYEVPPLSNPRSNSQD